MDDQKVVRSVIADAIEFAAQGPGTRCAPKAKSVLGSDESMRIAAAVLGALAGQGFQAVRVPAEFPPFTNNKQVQSWLAPSEGSLP